MCDVGLQDSLRGVLGTASGPQGFECRMIKNIGALLIAIGFSIILYCNCTKEPQISFCNPMNESSSATSFWRWSGSTGGEAQVAH